jgi:hypothetical protein
MSSRRAMAVVCMGFLLAGCASINRETHYIKAVDSLGYPVNYFRVSVAGSTQLSSSRYLSGFFPESAVDIYFGQIPQPKDGQFIEIKKDSAAPPVSDTATTAGNAVEAAAVGGPPGTKLVLLLSSRAESVAGEISDIARNEELMRNITKLVFKNEIEDALEASRNERSTRSRLDALISIGDVSIEQLDDDASAETATAKLLLFTNQVAFEFGNRVPFTTLQQAADWYNQNRDTLVGRPTR